MTTSVKPTPSNFNETSNYHQLALRTLSTLLRQHYQKHDLKDLLRTFVLSVSGQFRIPSAFIWLSDPPVNLPNQLAYFGVGQFRKCEEMIGTINKDAIIKRFGDSLIYFSFDDLGNTNEDEALREMLRSTGIRLIMAFRHDTKIIGLLGLGSRPPEGRLSEEDIEILATYATSVAPFLGNLFLFFTLAHVNQRHTNILNATKQAVLVFDRNGCLLNLNNAAKELILADRSPGSSNSSLIGMSHRLIFPPQLYPNWESLLSELESNEWPLNKCLIVTRTDSVGRVYRISITFLDETLPKQSDIVVVIDDITEQKLHDEQMLALQIAAEKGYMTAGIAHEMNNFITIILGSAEMALEMHKKSKQDAMVGHLETLIDKASVLKRFTDGLIDKHSLEPELTDENVNKVITKLVSFVQIQRRFANIEMKLILDDQIPDIQMDPNQISQVILNILNNAADAINEANREKGFIEIKTFVKEKRVLIQVHDNGNGIDKKNLGRLFKSQFTTKKSGHGYGMVMCDKIISSHSGGISVESEVGKGTTFSIWLPIEKIN